MANQDDEKGETKEDTREESKIIADVERIKDTKPVPAINRGSQRWKILSSAVKNRQISTTKDGDKKSVKSFETFKLMHFESQDDSSWVTVRWNSSLLSSNQQNPSLQLKVVPSKFSLDDIAGFDNSGNVRIWPCEELLAYMCSFDWIRARLIDSVVCEIGGGMTAMAGLFVAQIGICKKIYLTDGNERSVENIQEIVDENLQLKSSNKIQVRRLRWENPEDSCDLVHSIETIIGADCLFVPKYHRHLLNTLDNLLTLPKPNFSNSVKESAQVFIVAPQRDNTLDQFVELVKLDNRFNCSVLDCFGAEFLNRIASDLHCRNGVNSQERSFLVLLSRNLDSLPSV